MISGLGLGLGLGFETSGLGLEALGLGLEAFGLDLETPCLVNIPEIYTVKLTQRNSVQYEGKISLK